MAAKKIRLDQLLLERGTAPTLEKARALILARAVKVNDAYIDKTGTPVPVDADIKIKGEDNPYVSRGGLKLAGALKTFNLNVKILSLLMSGLPPEASRTVCCRPEPGRFTRWMSLTVSWRGNCAKTNAWWLSNAPIAAIMMARIWMKKSI